MGGRHSLFPSVPSAAPLQVFARASPSPSPAVHFFPHIVGCAVHFPHTVGCAGRFDPHTSVAHFRRPSLTSSSSSAPASHWHQIYPRSVVSAAEHSASRSRDHSTLGDRVSSAYPERLQTARYSGHLRADASCASAVVVAKWFCCLCFPTRCCFLCFPTRCWLPHHCRRLAVCSISMRRPRRGSCDGSSGIRSSSGSLRGRLDSRSRRLLAVPARIRSRGLWTRSGADAGVCDRRRK